MPEALPQDHDQRLKVLLKEFFEQFFLCFFPEWAPRFDFGTVTWLDKEVFLGPPQGEKRQLDLVARLHWRLGRSSLDANRPARDNDQCSPGKPGRHSVRRSARGPEEAGSAQEEADARTRHC